VASPNYPGFTEHGIDTLFNSPTQVSFRDMDRGGDYDVLACSGYNVDGYFTWWEDIGGYSFIRHNVDTIFYRGTSVCGADIDNDDAIDIVATSRYLQEISWWRNDGNQDYTKHIISNSHCYPTYQSG
jgi:hypothetical protein